MAENSLFYHNDAPLHKSQREFLPCQKQIEGWTDCSNTIPGLQVFLATIDNSCIHIYIYIYLNNLTKDPQCSHPVTPSNDPFCAFLWYRLFVHDNQYWACSCHDMTLLCQACFKSLQEKEAVMHQACINSRFIWLRVSWGLVVHMIGLQHDSYQYYTGVGREMIFLVYLCYWCRNLILYLALWLKNDIRCVL